MERKQDRWQDIDRYRYVEKGRSRRQKKSKSGCSTFLIAVVLIAVLLFGGVFGLVYLRMDYEAASVGTENREEILSSKAVLNILLIGADQNTDGTNGRSDTMMLVSVDTEDKVLRLVSFMRDTYVDIPSVGPERLNAAFAYGGAALTIETIETHYGIRIDGYAMTNFEHFVELIDAMDGIDLEIAEYEAEFISTESNGFSAEAGMNHLSGEQALFFARMRKLDSDFGRTGRQRQVMMAIFEKFKEQSLTEKVTTAYGYMPYITHDLSPQLVAKLSTVAAQLSDYEIETLNVPVDGSFWDEYAVIGGVEGNMVLGVDFEANKQALEAFLYS